MINSTTAVTDSAINGRLYPAGFALWQRRLAIGAEQQMACLGAHALLQLAALVAICQACWLLWVLSRR